MNIIKIMLLPGAMLLVIIVFGLWLGMIGKPYNNLLFNIHKLVALGSVILTGFRLLNLDPLTTFPNSAILMIGLAVLGVIGMFTTGAIMSIKDEVPKAARIIHRIFTGIISLSLLFAIYFIISEQLKTL